MSNEIRSIAPQSLWSHFADLNAVPRPSKKEARVIAFMEEFGRGLGLETLTDEVGNVIIKKPASPGMEGRKTVVMQGHLDMVHQKNAGTAFDFEQQGIEMLREDDWVRAQGTTLGADNGIGVAAIMAILSSKDIAHPAIEALFTIDEETGMTGALALQGGLLQGAIMLNLDTEDDRELTIGCAGGIDVTGTGSYALEAAPAGFEGLRIAVSGLTGGHSGMDIHRGRGNANKLMNRLLQAAAGQGARVATIDGGSLRNAIPRESVAVLAVNAQGRNLMLVLDELKAKLLSEHRTTDPKLSIVVEACAAPQQVMAVDFQGKLLRVVGAIQNGILRMSPDIDGLVQTSNNLARILVGDGKVSLQCLTRSAVDSEKMDLAQTIAGTMELCGCSVTTTGDYPGWEPRPDATIVRLMAELYADSFGHAPLVNACHAGLECGILGRNYPDMEMISFGPNIVGAHSPDERVQISSVEKFWGLLLKTLAAVPA